MTPRLSPLEVYGERFVSEMFNRLIFEPHINRLKHIIFKHCGLQERKIHKAKVKDVARLITLDPTKRSFEELVLICFAKSSLPKVGKE